MLVVYKSVYDFCFVKCIHVNAPVVHVQMFGILLLRLLVCHYVSCFL